jgi:hypothetical protein
MKRTYIDCDKCSRQISRSVYNRHYARCDGSLTYWDKRRLGILQVDDSVICKFCSIERKNPNSRRNHERLCKMNPERQTTYLQDNPHILRDRVQRGVHSNQYTKARMLGLPIPEVSAETRKRIGDNNRKRSPELLAQIAKSVSNTVKRKVAEGTWHTSLAKKMHHNYKGIDLHGTWELKYAQWLDAKGIVWERCKTQFTYTFEDAQRRYTPDFYLVESDTYIEIKGYATAKDAAKWSQIPAGIKLQVLKEQDLKDMGVI